MLIVQILQGLMEGVFLFLIASGLTLIFGVSRIVNFAHGSFYMLGAFLTYQIHPWIAAGTPGGFFTSILLCGVLVALIGLAFELFFLRRVYHAEELMQLVLTLAAVLIIRDLTKFFWGLDDVTVQLPDALSGAVITGGMFLPTYQLAMVAVGVLVLVALWAVLKFTRGGDRAPRRHRRPRDGRPPRHQPGARVHRRLPPSGRSSPGSRAGSRPRSRA